MKVDDVIKEINEYVGKNTSVLSAAVYSDNIQLNAYAKTITKVKGKFPKFHKILTHVVQGFGKAEWTELGEAEFKHKMLENFRQKINFSFIPDEILNTWLAELYVENKKAEDHPISKHIIDELLEKVVDDLDLLSQTAEYDDNKLNTFGYSLDGISAQVKKAVAHTKYPAFKIPLNALSATNIIDEVKSFEKGLPKKTRRKVKYLFMSDTMALEYADQYEQTYGTKVTYVDGDKMKTPLSKLQIVGLENIPDDCMFAFVDGNLGRLIDLFDKPEITDVQKLNYEVKIFMEFWLGYDFLMNHLAYVAVFDGSKRGLGNEKLNELYYPGEKLTVA